MPKLTRRRSSDQRHECWHIYYGDNQAGTITIRTGNPHETDPWQWRCGFYPGSHPGEHQSGTAATFDQARADFESAWNVFLSNRTDQKRRHAFVEYLDFLEVYSAAVIDGLFIGVAKELVRVDSIITLERAEQWHEVIQNSVTSVITYKYLIKFIAKHRRVLDLRRLSPPK